MKKIRYNQGFSLLEMLVYVTILAMLMVIVVTVLTSVTKSYASLKASKNLNHAAVVSLERMTREIRGANSLVTASSVLDASPGKIYLQGEGTDSIEFYLDSGVLKMNMNGVYEGPLTSDETTVTDLVFTHSSTDESEAVRIDMTIESGTGDKMKTERFYSTVVLRGSY